jgi:TolA-binding protein
MKTQDPNDVTEIEDRDDPDAETIRDPSTGQQAKVGTAIENVYEELSGEAEFSQGQFDALQDRVDELEEQVDRQEKVIYDLMELIELLGIAVGKEAPDAWKSAPEIRDYHGSDAYPWSYDSETLQFRGERYE